MPTVYLQEIPPESASWLPSSCNALSYTLVPMFCAGVPCIGEGGGPYSRDRQPIKTFTHGVKI
jgi:hypothetical protein